MDDAADPVLRFRRRRPVDRRRRRARCCRTRRSSMPPIRRAFPMARASEAEIAARVPALLGRLAERYRPRLIVIACNTASTIALPRGARRARPADRRHGARDQARRRAQRDADDRRARHRGDGAPAPMSTISRRGSPPTARCCATARRRWSSWPRRSCAARATDPARYRRGAGRAVRPAGRRARST